MGPLLLEILIAVLFIPLFHRCWVVSVSEEDNAECEIRWQNAMQNPDSNRYKRKCVEYIQNKCPDFLKVEEGVTYQVRTLTIKWTIESKATSPGHDSDAVSYTTTKKTGICKGKDELNDCQSWFNAGSQMKDINSVVERCVKLALKYCPEDVKMLPETKEDSFYNSKKVEIVTFTYQYEDTVLSFKEYLYKDQ